MTSFLDRLWFYVVSVAIAVVLAGLTRWLTRRVARPRRRLAYRMLAVTPRPLDAGEDVRQGPQARRNGRGLTDPHVLKFTLVNLGREDIPKSAFDRPLVLDAGVPILEVLEATTSPGHALPVVEPDGTGLRISPDLIAPGRKLSFSLLVDGSTPTLTCPPPHPVNTDVRDNGRAPVPSMLTAMVVTLPPTAGSLALAGPRAAMTLVFAGAAGVGVGTMAGMVEARGRGRVWGAAAGMVAWWRRRHR